ncbi:hypothetical protein L210DRAFT_3652924 [Boletus edulis BED1]|uniref:Uncharacterized protein n=1 Tax=Boletus edulis BED1 TaxID=1328754 RepID=A0AAD4BFM0_BOLED|nr:hypothetical protein L210DRAFT_3652924 [Boletus edulis BED1]
MQSLVLRGVFATGGSPFHFVYQFDARQSVSPLVAAKAILSPEDGLDAAKIATQVHFGTNYATLKAEQAIKSLAGGPLCTEEGRFAASLPNPATNRKLAPSKSQRDPRFLVTRGVLIDGEAAAVRAGKGSRWILALRTTAYCSTTDAAAN